MFIRNVMIEDITTVSPDDTLQKAYDLIQTKHYDELPVMHDSRHLIGVIQNLDIYEACMKHGRDVALAMKVHEVMTEHPITVSPSDPIEHAAKIMFDREVPMLPVVDDDELVGVITESDIFRAFAEMLGVNSGTVRLTLVVPERRGQLARIAEIIRDAGISITHCATFHSKVLQQHQIIVRVETDSAGHLVELLEQHHYKVIHVDQN